MVEEMKLRNFSVATQESYLYAVTRLTKYYRRSPDQLDREQIRSYLLHLTVERKLSPNTMMGQIAGLRFFYNQTLGWEAERMVMAELNPDYARQLMHRFASSRVAERD
jgi:site-specific recombinase XerD